MSVELSDYLEGGLAVVVYEFVQGSVHLIVLVSVNHHDGVVVGNLGDNRSDGRDYGLVIVGSFLDVEYTSVIKVGNACYIYYQRGGPTDVPYIPAAEMRPGVIVAEYGAEVSGCVMVVRPVCHYGSGSDGMSVSGRRGAVSVIVAAARACLPRMCLARMRLPGMRLAGMRLSGMRLNRAAVRGRCSRWPGLVGANCVLCGSGLVGTGCVLRETALGGSCVRVLCGAVALCLAGRLCRTS